MLTNLLMDVAAQTTSEFPWAFALVYIAGFVAAIVGGSIAWYNSKRPPGWEGAERPDIVPDIKAEESEESKETQE